LYLPSEYVPVEDVPAERRRGPESQIGPYLADVPEIASGALSEIVDDRERIREGDRVLLIIEDDDKFARILVNMAGESGFKAIVATRGDTGIAMANEFHPDAITLDVQLPVIDGISVFAHLKRNAGTRHIPVHVITVVEKSDGPTRGAFAYLDKPVDKETLDRTFARMTAYLDRNVRQLLVVCRSDADRKRLALLLGEGDDVAVTGASTPDDARTIIESRPIDCVVMALTSEDHDAGLALAESLKTRPGFAHIPVVVCTSKAMTISEQQSARLYAESVLLRTGDDVPAQLLADACLFLHRAVQGLPAHTRAELALLGPPAPARPRKILVVDDDVRNVFAMSSALEGKGLEVIYAENGRRALEALRQTPDIGVILMDIMMPEMDGFEAIKAIRADSRYKAAPIIAVTAKALKEDRERCIRAGASDYLPKPIDTVRLLEAIDVWVH
jgi:CheY-like chemotaxis protein